MNKQTETVFKTTLEKLAKLENEAKTTKSWIRVPIAEISDWAGTLRLELVWNPSGSPAIVLTTGNPRNRLVLRPATLELLPQLVDALNKVPEEKLKAIKAYVASRIQQSKTKVFEL